MHRILGILIKMIPSETTAVSRQMSIAHELGHGTNSLHHTFSPESETFYTTSKTDNLMDYNAGEYLNHHQWQWSHEKHRNVLGFLDDEGEGEMLAAISVVQILEAIKIDNQKGNNCTDLSLWAGKKSFENKLTLSDNLILEYIDVNIALTKNANNKNNPLQIEPLQINPILLHTTKVEVSSGEDEQFVKIYYNRIGKKTLAETSASEQNEEAISFVIKEIDGKGYDVNKKQYYYHFLEVGTESNMKGTNENNRLYIYNNEIKGTRGFDTREYILTEIRKHSLSGDACP